ncbi:hypothetical protein GN244_ATG13723 [Phytophthora infestans]|uniref:Secreted RxLR effector peptide protein n=1 Tax=Phytophthora infestans TaxID=4787 RepID=A0A833SX92_PHYIN|nr:hypothetical protein GN244_ATG13723 [Phytophthora infestans]
MSLYLIVLLFVAVLLANIEQATSFELTTAGHRAAIHPLADHQSLVAPKRLMRRNDEDNDERTAVRGATITELATKVKGGASKLVQKLVNISNYEDQVLMKLKLSHHVDDALTSSNLQRLAEEVQKISSKNTKKTISVVGTLTFKYGDDALASALVKAEGNLGSTLQIKTLRQDQLRRWLDGGNSADDVAKLLKFDNNKMYKVQKLEVLDDYVKLVNPQNYYHTLLSALIKGVPDERKLVALLSAAKENARFTKTAKFVKYVDDYNRKEPTNAKSALEIYLNRFKDTTVANKLAAVMDDGRAKHFAKQLQTEQLNRWVRSKKSVDEVFGMMKFADAEGAAITRRKMDTLVKFIESEGGGKPLINTLTKNFGGKRELALILEEVSKRAEATPLQFATWIAKDISPENVISRIFKKGVGTASSEEKAIARKFQAFYQSRASG